MKKLGAIVFKACQKLYMAKLLPWFIWSPIYDKLHRCGGKRA